MTHVLARIHARPDSAPQVRAILVELRGHSRSEAGCVSYDLYQRADDPTFFQTVEQWRDTAVADLHMKTPHVAAAIRQIGALLAAAPEIVRFEKLT